MVQNGNIGGVGTGNRNSGPVEGVELRVVKILDDERARQDMSLRGLAKVTGASHPTLSRLFAGERTMTMREFQAICKALRLTDWRVMRDAEEG